MNSRIKSRVKRSLQWINFAFDYLLSLASDNHTASPASYRLMRRLYSLTEGKSSIGLSKPFRYLHQSHSATGEAANIASQLQRFGYAKICSSSDSANLARELHERLCKLPVTEVLNGFKPGIEFTNPLEGLSSAERTGARLSHKRRDVVKQAETWRLIELLEMKEIATCYLGCDPIITSVDSWHVAPIRESTGRKELYSAAAQTYHYDMDWIRFVKVFVNLTQAPIDSGPFEFIPFSHLKKNSIYYQDGRFEKLSDSELAPVLADGDSGSAFWADTSGIHRDGRANSSTRHVLQVEFAVSSFGAKFQYNDIYQSCKRHMPWQAVPDAIKTGRALTLYRGA